jgi:hypothetical protein
MWLSVSDDYEVSENGEVRHKRFQRVLRGSVSNGYRSVKLGKYGGKFYVHRIVAGAFLPAPTGICEVDHIDRDRTNNAASNLRWVTKSENNKNRTSIRTHLSSNRLGEHHICEWRGRYVVYGSLDIGHIHKYFKTLDEAKTYRDAVFT